MPTYDYQCKGCGHRFDELQSFSEPPLSKCPACKKNKLERLFGGGGAIIFKGSGFYETDYRKDSYKSAEKADAPDGGKSEGNGDTKADATPAASGTEAAKPAAEAPAPAAKASKPASGVKSGGKGGKKAT